MASGPRHLRDSFVSAGLRKTAQTLSATEQVQVQNNLGISPSIDGGYVRPVLTDFTSFGSQAISDSQALSGAGAVDITHTVTLLTSTGANALTLANGAIGQLKEIHMIVNGGDATLTPSTKTGYSTIVFNDIGDGVLLRFFTTKGWLVIANFGCTIS